MHDNDNPVAEQAPPRAPLDNVHGVAPLPVDVPENATATNPQSGASVASSPVSNDGLVFY